jgi:regulator of sigma E protease
MEFWIKAAQLLMSLSILVVLHELGHFIPARLFKTKVEKFYLFFDVPPIGSLFKRKVGETEYGIGWLPLGGYVKIAGMIDESMDREQMKLPPQPWEFRSKPAWQRLIIMLGGVTVNFILGLFLYGIVIWVWGLDYLPNQNATYGIYTDSLGYELGLRDGDKMISVGGVPFEKFNQGVLVKEIVINDANQIVVERNGQQQTITFDNKAWKKELASGKKSLFSPRMPMIVENLQPDGVAEKAGIQKGDQIIALNGVPTPYFQDFKKQIVAVAPKQEKQNWFGKKVPEKTIDINLLALRGNDTLQFTLPVGSKAVVGVVVKQLETKQEKYTLAQALPKGVQEGLNFLGLQIKGFGQMFTGGISVTDSLGGFGSIGNMFDANWDWQNFWQMTAILSLILAFMNLLPIPALDGGHVMFLIGEIITGRKPSDRLMEIATTIGFVLLISLVLFANINDIRKFFF